MVKNLPANAEDIRDMGSIPGLGRSPGEENGNSLQYSWLRDPMDRGAWRATVHGVTRAGQNLETKQQQLKFKVIVPGLIVKMTFAIDKVYLIQRRLLS